ncbi:MAG: HAMP domain-containing histidine kinase [Propionibacteriaceae bacterium]|nr:HAMP domain-containing histidine kinase [Propionibacteriaceae bacterium]
MRKRSLRTVLTMWVVLLLVGVSVVLTLAAMYNAREVFIVRAPDPAASSLSPAGPTISSSDSVPSASAPSPDPAGSASVPPSGLGDGPSLPPPRPSDQPTDGILMAPAGSDGSLGTPSGGVIVSTQFTQRTLWVMVAVILVAGLVTWFLLGRALKPLRALSGEIATKTENDLSTPIGEPGSNDEISSLARSFNTLMARLGKVFADQKRFASDAAHELKTPLTVMRTNVDVLRLSDSPTKDEYEHAIEVVDKQARRMTQLVDDLFALSAQRGFEMDDRVDLDAMLAEIVDQLRPAIAEKNLTIAIDSGPLVVQVNSVMLGRAIANIIENAIKYNTSGGRVDITLADKDGRPTITIADSGIGIPSDKLGDIFHPFYRVDSSRSRKVGGAGLGLAITQDVIKRHGGAIDVTSGDQGTTFTIRLPKAG